MMFDVCGVIMMMASGKRVLMVVLYFLGIIVDAVAVAGIHGYVYAICLAIGGVIYANRVVSAGDVLVHDIIVIVGCAAEIQIVGS